MTAHNWPPMSEAPRDGTPIKAWDGDDWVVVHWWQPDPAHRGYWCELGDDGEVYFDHVLTHWLPIEAPADETLLAKSHTGKLSRAN